MTEITDGFPDPSIRRLSAYLRQLEQLAARGVKHVSSRQLATYMKVGPAMVRRDLTLFGHFGHRGLGYTVPDLIQSIRGILGTLEPWKVVLVGAGELGHAMIKHPGFLQQGFQIVAVFDSNPKMSGTQIGEISVSAMEMLPDVILQQGARLGVLTVPDSVAQEAADMLVEAGIEGILNFATTPINVPEHIHLTQVDLTAHLEQLSFRIKND